MKGWSKLNWSSSKGIWIQKQVGFQVVVNNLFDISVPTIIDMIIKGQRKTEDAKKEDVAFNKDQRSKRNMTMTAHHDEELEIKALRRKQKYERVRQLNDQKNTKAQKEKRTLQIFDRLQKSIDEKSTGKALDGQIEFEDDVSPFGSSILCEESDDSEYDVSKSKKLKIILELTPDELIEATSALSVRYRIGVRPQTAIISSICNKAGVDLHEVYL